MNEFSRYPSDIENFRNVNFKVEPANPQTVAKEKKLTPIGEKRAQTKKLRASITKMKAHIKAVEEGSRPTEETMNLWFGPIDND